MEFHAKLIGGRAPAIWELQAERPVGVVPPSFPAVAPFSLGHGAGDVGALCDQRLQSRSGIMWAIMQTPVAAGADTAAVVMADCQQLVTTTEARLGRKFLHIV